MRRKADSRKRPQLRVQMARRKDIRKEIFDLAMLFTQTKVIEALEYGKRPPVFSQRDSVTPVFCIRSGRIKSHGPVPADHRYRRPSPAVRE